jgi:hypothetical protein
MVVVRPSLTGCLWLQINFEQFASRWNAQKEAERRMMRRGNDTKIAESWIENVVLVEEQGVDINNKEVVCATMAISIYFLHACLISRSFLSSSEA